MGTLEAKRIITETENSTRGASRGQAAGGRVRGLKHHENFMT